MLREKKWRCQNLPILNRTTNYSRDTNLNFLSFTLQTIQWSQMCCWDLRRHCLMCEFNHFHFFGNTSHRFIIHHLISCNRRVRVQTDTFFPSDASFTVILFVFRRSYDWILLFNSGGWSLCTNEHQQWWCSEASDG